MSEYRVVVTLYAVLNVKAKSYTDAETKFFDKYNAKCFDEMDFKGVEINNINLESSKIKRIEYANGNNTKLITSNNY